MDALTASTLHTTPALAFVGRKNSGKTTLTCKLIAELTRRGVDVASLKHHGHPDFEFDQPGRDSYRQHAAGARTSAVFSDKRFGLVRELTEELPLNQALSYLQGHDLVIVEGFRRGRSLPIVELMRSGNERDQQIRNEFLRVLAGAPSDTWDVLPEAVVTDMEDVALAAAAADIPTFTFEDIASLADYVMANHTRPKLSVCIQAGGESKRMGQSKALVPFLGRPLIQTMVERLSPIADELVITTNESERLVFLKETHPDIIFATDVLETRGAVPGMITALSAGTTPYMAIVACDMVAASPELLAAEAALLRDPRYDAVVPCTHYGYEPFAGVYRRAVALRAAQHAWNQGSYRMAEVLDMLNCLKLHRDNPWKITFPLGCFMNVNTPSELAFAERLLGGTY